jgi:hypothetical protein
MQSISFSAGHGFFFNPGRKPKTVAEAKPRNLQSPAAHAQLLRCGRPKTVVMLESESMTAAKLSQKRTVGRTSRVSLVKHGTMARSQPSWLTPSGRKEEEKTSEIRTQDLAPISRSCTPFDYRRNVSLQLLENF